MTAETNRRSFCQKWMSTVTDDDIEKSQQSVSTMTGTDTCLDVNNSNSSVLTPRISSHMSLIKASFPTLIVLTLVLVSAVLGRQYVIDMLIYLDSLNRWESAVLFGVMFSLAAFPIMSGYLLLNIACGYTYGFVYGALMTSACSTYAILCAHFVMRRFCKSYVERNYVMGAQARALLDVLSGRNGYKIVFLMRFTPIPFGLQNAIFAVSGIKSGPYLISSTLGLSFTQFAYSYMGSRFRSIAEVFNNDNSTTAWLLLSLQLSLMLILMVVVVVLAKQELDRNVREGDDDDCESLSTMQSKGIQTVNSPDKRCEFVTSKSRSHSRNMSVNIPPIVASGVHVV